MGKRYIAFLFLSFTAILFFCIKPCHSLELSTELSSRTFYLRPEEIIQNYEKKKQDCQNNYILAGAYLKRKKLKSALLYFSNSCFDNKYNFNLRLFPHPVYSFIESDKGRSIFYQDSVYYIAQIFYEYNEHEYVMKFTDLLRNDSTALYRDSILLRSKSLEKLKRYSQAGNELLKISALYSDSESQSLIQIRLGAVYESVNDYQKAAESYFNVIRTESGSWQNRIAAGRLIYLLDKKKYSIDTSEEIRLLSAALFDAGEFDRALTLINSARGKLPELIISKTVLKNLAAKNYAKAATFLHSKKSEGGYNELKLFYADLLWDNKKKSEAAKLYAGFLYDSDRTISEKSLARVSLYFEESNNREFIKYMNLYLDKFPENEQCGRFIWLIGRHYMKNSENKKAVEYFKRGIKNHPDMIYASRCRFWLNRLEPSKSKEQENYRLLQEYIQYNPDSYYTISILKEAADKADNSALENEFIKAYKEKNEKMMLLYHTLLFIKNGYNSSYSDRIKRFSGEITQPYLELSSLIKKNVVTGSYSGLLKKLEVYFYAGDLSAVNRELRLIPEENSAAQKETAAALAYYGLKHRQYNYMTFYSFRLLKLMNLKENLPLIPRDFAEALYPFAFPECVNSESKKYKVKPELTLAMIKVESNFNPGAISPAGAHGLMQIMPDTAKEIADDPGIRREDLVDPCTSIRYGVSYIARLDRYYKGKVEYMIAAYNAGAGNVDKWKKMMPFGDTEFFSEFIPYAETSDYIFRTKKYAVYYGTIYKNRK